MNNLDNLFRSPSNLPPKVKSSEENDKKIKSKLNSSSKDSGTKAVRVKISQPVDKSPINEKIDEKKEGVPSYGALRLKAIKSTRLPLPSQIIGGKPPVPAIDNLVSVSKTTPPPTPPRSKEGSPALPKASQPRLLSDSTKEELQGLIQVTHESLLDSGEWESLPSSHLPELDKSMVGSMGNEAVPQKLKGEIQDLFAALHSGNTLPYKGQQIPPLTEDLLRKVEMLQKEGDVKGRKASSKVEDEVVKKIPLEEFREVFCRCEKSVEEEKQEGKEAEYLRIIKTFIFIKPAKLEALLDFAITHKEDGAVSGFLESMLLLLEVNQSFKKVTPLRDSEFAIGNATIEDKCVMKELKKLFNRGILSNDEAELLKILLLRMVDRVNQNEERKVSEIAPSERKHESQSQLLTIFNVALSQGEFSQEMKKKIVNLLFLSCQDKMNKAKKKFNAGDFFLLNKGDTVTVSNNSDYVHAQNVICQGFFGLFLECAKDLKNYNDKKIALSNFVDILIQAENKSLKSEDYEVGFAISLLLQNSDLSNFCDRVDALSKDQKSEIEEISRIFSPFNNFAELRKRAGNQVLAIAGKDIEGMSALPTLTQSGGGIDENKIEKFEKIINFNKESLAVVKKQKIQKGTDAFFKLLEDYERKPAENYETGNRIFPRPKPKH